MRYNTYHSPARVLFDIINSSNPRQSLVHNTPHTNLIEHESSYILELAAPGLSKQDFVLSVQEYHLTISANVDHGSDQQLIGNKEFDFSKFSRKIRLPKDVNKEEIKASYSHGILHVTLPKLTKDEVNTSRVIEIS